MLSCSIHTQCICLLHCGLLDARFITVCESHNNYYPKKVSRSSAFRNFQHRQTLFTCLPVQECLDWLLEEEEDDGPVGGGYEEGHHAACHQMHGLRVPVRAIEQVFRRDNDDGLIPYHLLYIGDLHDDWQIEKFTLIFCTIWCLYCWLLSGFIWSEGLLKMVAFPIKCVSNISKYNYITWKKDKRALKTDIIILIIDLIWIWIGAWYLICAPINLHLSCTSCLSRSK